MELALEALQADKSSWSYRETLAAALAETGDFSRAIDWQLDAILQCHAQGEPTAALSYRLELYLQQKPYRQSQAANGLAKALEDDLKLPSVRPVLIDSLPREILARTLPDAEREGGLGDVVGRGQFEELQDQLLAVKQVMQKRKALVRLHNHVQTPAIPFKLRWLSWQGKWSDWSEETLGSGKTWTYWMTGAVDCEIEFGTGGGAKHYHLHVAMALDNEDHRNITLPTYDFSYSNGRYDLKGR